LFFENNEKQVGSLGGVCFGVMIFVFRSLVLWV